MNRKKLILWIIIAVLIICIILAVCFWKTSPAGGETPEPTISPVSPTPSAGEETASPDISPSPSISPASPSQSPSAAPAASPENTPDPLDAIELFFNSVPANGMLCSEYSDVRSANMHELLYQCSDESVPFSTVYSAYEDEFGDDSVQTDLSYMSSAVLNKLLTSLTGYGLDEDWNFDEVAYLAAADVYCVQHGDTNYSPVKCVSLDDLGGGLYAVTCRSPLDGGELSCRDESGEYRFAAGLRVTLRKTDDGYQFVSNQIIE